MRYMKPPCARPIAAITLAILLATSSAHAITFEYKVVDVQRILAGSSVPASLAIELDRHGRNGWELIQINNNGLAIFKRAVP